MIHSRVELTALRVLADSSIREEAVAARVVHPIGPSHLRALAGWPVILSRHGEEDAGWDWAEFLEEANRRMRAGTESYDSFVVMCEKEVQAAMIIEWRAKVERVSRQPLVYVEYIAVAPHNRPGIQRPRFRGSGTALIRTAVAVSRELGRGGAIGLHSKPRAIAFYLKAGFRDFGPDPSEGGLHYMELYG